MAQKYTVTHDSPLLEYLFELYQGQSRTGVRAYLKDDRVLVNGESRTAFDWPLRKGDRLEVISKDASIGRDMKTESANILQKNGISIVFEDEHLLVIEKNAGMPTISPQTSRNGVREKSVYSLLTDYMHTEKRANIKMGTGGYKSPSRVFVVHRLDRDTSGLIVFAKDEYTKNLMQSKWNDIVLERRYTAVIEGNIAQKEGRIESWLTENGKSLKMSSSKTDDGGLHAVTRFKVLEEYKRYTWISFELETGRKNQIRIHSAQELGHPIVGDKKYGSKLSFRGRIALHAQTLVFRNPYGGRILRFESPIPQAFEALK